MMRSLRNTINNCNTIEKLALFLCLKVPLQRLVDIKVCTCTFFSVTV